MLREMLEHRAEMKRGDRIASLVEHALDTIACDVVLVPTRGGNTARVISRSKPDVWIIAVSRDPAVCQGLAFSYGVHPLEQPEEPADWQKFTVDWANAHDLNPRHVILVAGPSSRNPHANHRIELIQLAAPPG
jgi:pyruvate kinase